MDPVSTGVAAMGSPIDVPGNNSDAADFSNLNSPELLNNSNGQGDGGQPRLSHARLAVPEDPSIKPYGCNSPVCLPSGEEMDALRDQFDRDLLQWRKDQAKLQANPATADQKPAGRHPSLKSVGVCFNASRDLLDHLRDAHQMRQKGEVHVSQLATTGGAEGEGAPANVGELAEDGKMFRCALVGCQRTWKNANGLQYHCLTSLNAHEHNIDTVNRRRPTTSGKRKKDEEGTTDDKPSETQPSSAKPFAGLEGQHFYQMSMLPENNIERSALKPALANTNARQSAPIAASSMSPFANFIEVPMELDKDPPKSTIKQPEPPRLAERDLTKVVEATKTDIPVAVVPAPKEKEVKEIPKEASHPQIFYCPYREKTGCKKEYKHKGAGVRHHIEQHHNKEPDFEEQLALLPAPTYKKPRAKETADSNRSAIPSSIAASMHSGTFTHGYIFSNTQQPYRPLGRPVDALYYLNILATAGVKTHQQRASERLLVNALLHADFIRNLQITANANGHNLDLVDERGAIKPPIRPIKPIAKDLSSSFSKKDVDSAILKLTRTLEEHGFGDTLEDMEIVE